MSRFRVFVLSLWVTCVCVGLVNGEEAVGEAAAEPPPENPVVFGGVEVCGPIYEAFLFLGPKDENGKLDPGQIEPWPHPSGLFRAEFPPPDGLSLEFAGLGPTSVKLGDFKGNTQTVIAEWGVGLDDVQAVWSSMSEELRNIHGEPHEEDASRAEWEKGRLRTTAVLTEDDGTVTLVYACIPSEDEFWARVKSAPVLEEVPEAQEVSDRRQPPERTLGSPLLEVLAMHGEPTVEPFWQSDKVVGMYYENFDLNGIPCRQWLWFVDGETVYRGYKFAPPFGPSHAVEAFEGFAMGLTTWYGKPYVHIGGEDFDRIQNRWLQGTEETVLGLEMADDPPWLSIETINREKIREIDGDLRPGGKPIPRYIPPPADSGKTRHELVGGTARG